MCSTTTPIFVILRLVTNRNHRCFQITLLCCRYHEILVFITTLELTIEIRLTARLCSLMPKEIHILLLFYIFLFWLCFKELISSVILYILFYTSESVILSRCPRGFTRALRALSLEKARTVPKRFCFCFFFFFKRTYRYICRYLPRGPYIKQALVLTVLWLCVNISQYQLLKEILQGKARCWC